jgi:hypothetical protein
MIEEIRRLGTIGVDLSYYRSLPMWNPQVGDIVIYHGWFWSRWFGVVSNINADGSCDIITGGLPVLLLTQGGKKREKNTVSVDIIDIKNSTSGKYAVVKSEQNRLIWYV